MVSWGCLLLYSAFLLHSAVLPPSQFPSWLPAIGDKWLHGFFFFIHYWFSFWAFQSFKKDRPHLFIAICSVFLVAFWGVITELAQYFAPHRTPDLLDWAADVVGGLIGFGLSYLFVRRFSSSH